MSLLPDTEAGLAAAVAVLRAGRVLGLPTETVYGLAADASRADAVRLVFATKGRPSTHPLIVHLPDFAAAQPWAAAWPAAATALANAFWPGPLTLVVPKAPQVLAEVTGGQDTVALRVPAHPLAQRVLREFGSALVAPSANRYGRVSPTSAADVLAEFDGTVPVLDGGECAVGLESTIVACLGGRVLVLRPGVITPAALSRVTGGEVHVAAAGEGPRAPGTTRAHYAPRTPVELVPLARLATRAAEVPGAAVIARGSSLAHGAQRPPAGTPCHAMPNGARDYGRVLYATLRRLDAEGATRLLVEAPPPDEAWAAVRDRLQRAAAAGELIAEG